MGRHEWNGKITRVNRCQLFPCDFFFTICTESGCTQSRGISDFGDRAEGVARASKAEGLMLYGGLPSTSDVDKFDRSLT